MLSADRPFVLVTRGPTAGNELRLPGRKAVWIVRLGATGSPQSPDGFVKRFSPLSLRREKGNLLVVMDPEYGEVRFHASGRVEAESRVVDPATWTVAVAALAGDVRIMWYSDGLEGEVINDLLARFMKDNPR